ncbi:hypothetical protein EV13_2235 [Prochlorococcus sp. MIT 0702]|nr:hypothetical protein EV13_2235 [Prochlorococcus sp. MIT 0702]KGG27189.1 hypothetical protein EV12_1328 [Prochlorococcus sp. MIT 0701]KGG35479.1 hypothetical protein EV14_0866 [Prochlorococcus sp. MIT 0703]
MWLAALTASTIDLTRPTATAFAFDIRLNQIPDKWHQTAVKFLRSNGIRDGNQTPKLW